MLPRILGSCFLGLGLLALSACTHLKYGSEPCGEEVGLTQIHSYQEPSLEAIARDLDTLERHIDLYGSITAKHPDVWGQARLTIYRQEFEQIFLKDLDIAKNFEVVYSGALTRSDQAFLASALALNLAITGQQAALLPPDPIIIETGSTTRTGTAETKQSRSDSTTGTSSASNKETANKLDSKSEEKASTDASSKTEGKMTTELKQPGVITTPTDAKIPNEFTNESKVTAAIKQKDAVLNQLPGFAGKTTITLEPTIVLDQKKRFLDHLHQLRRVNEGDDNADSPGYALYLMRVPVSVLPGKKTDIGHGAEITMSVEPIVGDDLLPLTFRNLIINDMVDQYSELLTVLVNENRDALKKLIEESYSKSLRGNSRLTTVNTNQVQNFIKAAKQVRPKYSAPRPSRNAEYAFPMGHIDELFDNTFVQSMILAVVDKYEQEIKENKIVHLHEVRSYVREQIVAGYRFLASAHPEVWYNYCTPELAKAVRDLNGSGGVTPFRTIKSLRKQYDDELGREVGGQTDISSERLLVKALAWGVLLESALLNELLVRDIKETATNKGYVPPATEWQDYFHPTPSPQAREAFNQYVRERWPIYTFAVDPVAEQQNIQDTFSQRREIQLALSLAFTSGRINAQQFTRFARRLEADYQTIDLNRTVVGFSHGDNTFGWRFYPRFQTPEIPSNLEVVFSDLLLGNQRKNQDIRERRLEPGQRECVALVVMPSFVPFAQMNVSSSWFSLTNPKHKQFSTQDTVRLSKLVRSVEVCNPRNQELYRSGEYSRLLAKANQLASRLPLQDTKFQVPYENTLGGFEFFNSGLTDLVPQLRGWYGAEGIVPGKDVELFLMGDNFSVNNSQLIAGGKKIAGELLSRQVIRVIIPKEALPSADEAKYYSESGQFVEVRLATAYGVTSRLRIPVIKEKVAVQVTVKPKPPELSNVMGNQGVYLDRDTELFLSGSNFTKEMKIIASGRDAPFEFLSPMVVKVLVPKGLKPNTVVENEARKPVIEIRAANNVGPSNPIVVNVIE